MATIFERLAAATCMLLSVQAYSAVSDGENGASHSAGSLAKISALRPPTLSGQSATQLPDGHWLLLGGRGADGVALADARIVDLKGGKARPLEYGLLSPRSGHSATLLPDGNVLVLGGTDADGMVVDGAELFTLDTGRFSALGQLGLIPRTQHSATVLVDGRLLIAGGIDARGSPVYDAELYNPATRFAEHFNAKLDSGRLAHLARLLPNTNVLLWGGVNSERKSLIDGELLDYAAGGFSVTNAEQADQLAAPLVGAAPPTVLSSNPAADATDVAVGQQLMVRFSKGLAVASLNTSTVTLLGSRGAIAVNAVPVEDGVLLFVTPHQQLLPASRYTLFIKGATDGSGQALPFTAIGFTTASLEGRSQPASTMVESGSGTAAHVRAAESTTNMPTAEIRPATSISSNSTVANTNTDRTVNTKPEEWHPSSTNFRGDWRVRRPASPLQSLPALQAASGTTALAGQVLTLHGEGLANVTVKIGEQTAQSDETGRFLLTNISAGTQVISIDGNTARQRGGQYGFYQVQVKIDDKKTNVLKYTIWLSRLDPAGNLAIPSPIATDTILTSPRIPGLELHIPAGTVIRDHNGKIVTELNITAIPTDRPPFPIPSLGVPVYFTIQPGGAVIENIGGTKLQGARLIYPNFTGAAPGTRINFWNYDARGKGWYIYGKGTVTSDRKQIVPDPGVVIYEFTGAMVAKPDTAPPDGPPENPCSAGDPVDVCTGLFLHEKVDLMVNDIIPLEVRRTYRPRDSASRAFGIGANLSYDLFIVGDIYPYTYIDLILPDGGRVRFPRTSPGPGYGDAVYTHPPTGSKFDGATIDHSNNCYWNLRLKDGTQICFPEAEGSDWPREAAAVEMSDRFGNKLIFERDSASNLVSVTSPNGRSLQFVYDMDNRITQATDNIGRQSSYQYDSGGRLIKATLPDGSFEAYTYDSNNNMLTVQDQRGNTMVTNVYESNGRVSRQTYADGKTNSFAYTLNSGGHATQVDVTNARGIITRYAFDSSRSPSSVTNAQGLPEQQIVSFERDSNGLMQSRTDALGRKTTYTYDANGNLLAKTSLAGTPNATTVTMTYTSDFNSLASITDPLGHQTLLSYDAQGHLIQTTDGNGNITKFAYNSSGLPNQVTDPLGKIYSSGFDGADLISVTDPLNRSVIFDVDSIGRAIGVTDANGNRTELSYDQSGRMSQVTDPLAHTTKTRFDANGNPAQIEDSKGNVHHYTYDSRNYLTGYADPLQQMEGYTYDGNRNVTSYTDRKGLARHYTYDNLDRLTQIIYADGSTVGYTYDQGNRATQVIDSLGGTISYTFDGFSRITSEATLKGIVSYTYYANGLRATMTVSGQPTVRYAYDGGNRLVRIDQDSGAANGSAVQSVVFAYDGASRRTRTTLPNGITLNYSYDDAGQLTDIVYKNAGSIQLGNLTYGYDAIGRRIKMGGTLARTIIPGDTTNASVDAANRLTNWNGTTLVYDPNGNLTNDGTNTYVWNVRNQLAQIKDASSSVIASFAYDARGRRKNKTINGTEIGYVYDEINVVQALAGANVDNSQPSNVLANYLTGLGIDELYSAITGTGADIRITSYLTDALGSALRLTDGAGAKLVDYTYEPYGATVSDATNDNPFQYTGRENDGTGLYYYRARYYSPSMSRFISSDPIGLNGGINTYGYVGGNPLSFIDPLGLMEIYRDGNVTMSAYPGPPGGGNEHARAGAGENYHVHIKDGSGREARISTETWKPLTPEDQRIYDRSKAMQNTCEKFSDGEKKFFDRVNRQIFHRGVPTINQIMRLGMIRGGIRGGTMRGSD